MTNAISLAQCRPTQPGASAPWASSMWGASTTDASELVPRGIPSARCCGQRLKEEWGAVPFVARFSCSEQRLPPRAATNVFPVLFHPCVFPRASVCQGRLAHSHRKSAILRQLEGFRGLPPKRSGISGHEHFLRGRGGRKVRWMDAVPCARPGRGAAHPGPNCHFPADAGSGHPLFPADAGPDHRLSRVCGSGRSSRRARTQYGIPKQY